MLEFIVENVALHWQDIVNLLIDDLLEAEVVELNDTEFKKTEEDRRKEKRNKTNLADKSIVGKFHDYQSADVRDILGIFDEYARAESSVRAKLIWLKLFITIF